MDIEKSHLAGCWPVDVDVHSTNSDEHESAVVRGKGLCLGYAQVWVGAIEMEGLGWRDCVEVKESISSEMQKIHSSPQSTSSSEVFAILASMRLRTQINRS